MFNLSKFNLVKFNLGSEDNITIMIQVHTDVKADAKYTTSVVAETSHIQTYATAQAIGNVFVESKRVEIKTDLPKVTVFRNRGIKPKEIQILTRLNSVPVVVYGYVVFSFSNFVLRPGQELTIDTNLLTATVDGLNVMHLVDDSSDFFYLNPGENTITYHDGNEEGIGRNADFKILYKDRWL